MSADEKDYQRLSDKVLEALELSLEQEDIAIAELLSRALEMSLTRNAGGADFTERREFSREIEQALIRLEELRKKS